MAKFCVFLRQRAIGKKVVALIVRELSRSGTTEFTEQDILEILRVSTSLVKEGYGVTYE